MIALQDLKKIYNFFKDLIKDRDNILEMKCFIQNSWMYVSPKRSRTGLTEQNRIIGIRGGRLKLISPRNLSLIKIQTHYIPYKTTKNKCEWWLKT